MNAAQDLTPPSGTGMTKIIGDCERLGRVTDGTSSALRRLESVLGPELADRLVGALASGRRARRPFL